MINIFLYELRRRVKAMIVFGSVVAGMTLISIVLSLVFNFKLDNGNFGGGKPIPDFAVIWWVLKVLAMFYVGIAMFYTCCSGHIREVLFKDTNYLMLTIPLPAWKIILGRWLAGLVEYMAYIVLIIVCGLTWLACLTPSSLDNYGYARLVLLNTVNNPLFILASLIFVVSSFALIGMMITMVNTLMRSLIKKQGFATAGAIVLFIFLFFLLNNAAGYLNSYLNWTVYVPITSFTVTSLTGASLGIKETNAAIPFQMLIPIMWFLLSLPFFFVSSWLLEHKVEL